MLNLGHMDASGYPVKHSETYVSSSFHLASDWRRLILKKLTFLSNHVPDESTEITENRLSKRANASRESCPDWVNPVRNDECKQN